MRSHQGPSTTTIAAITSTHPGQRPQQVPRLPGQQARSGRCISSRPATATRSRVRRRVLPRSRPSSGSASWRSVACSSAGAFRQISTRPTALMTSGQPHEPSQPAPSSGGDDQHHDRAATPGPAASAMPRRSAMRPARDAAVRAGRRHQQPGHHIGGHAEAAQQGGQDERGPHDRDVQARPGRESGGHAAGQAVVPGAPQRPAGLGPRTHPPGPCRRQPRRRKGGRPGRPSAGVAVVAGWPGAAGNRLLLAVRVPVRRGPGCSCTSPSSRLSARAGYPGKP